jgi:hypothetical protein
MAIIDSNSAATAAATAQGSIQLIKQETNDKLYSSLGVNPLDNGGLNQTQ